MLPSQVQDKMLNVSGVVAICSNEGEVFFKEGEKGTTFFFDVVTRIRKEKKEFNIRRVALFVPKDKVARARKYLKRKQLIHILNGSWSIKKESEQTERHWISTTWHNIALVPYALNE